MSDYISKNIDKDTLCRNLANTLALRDAHLEYGIPSYLTPGKESLSYPEYVRRAESRYYEEFKYFDLDNVRILGMKQHQNVVVVDKAFMLSGLILPQTIADILTRILNDEVVSIKFMNGKNLKIQKEDWGIVIYENRGKAFEITDMKELQQFIRKVSPYIIRYGSKPVLGPVVDVVEKGGG